MGCSHATCRWPFERGHAAYVDTYIGAEFAKEVTTARTKTTNSKQRNNVLAALELLSILPAIYVCIWVCCVPSKFGSLGCLLVHGSPSASCTHMYYCSPLLSGNNYCYHFAVWVWFPPVQIMHTRQSKLRTVCAFIVVGPLSNCYVHSTTCLSTSCTSSQQ